MCVCVYIYTYMQDLARAAPQRHGEPYPAALPSRIPSHGVPWRRGNLRVTTSPGSTEVAGAALS